MQPVAEVVVCIAAVLSRRIALAIILSYSSTGRANKETWVGVGAIFRDLWDSHLGFGLFLFDGWGSRTCISIWGIVSLAVVFWVDNLGLRFFAWIWLRYGLLAIHYNTKNLVGMV